MLVCSRFATPNEVSRDEMLMNWDICAPDKETPEPFAVIEMRQVSSFRAGDVATSPTTTTQSRVSSLLSGAHNITQKILSLFHSLKLLCKDTPTQLNRLSDGLVHFLDQAIECRRAQMKSVEENKQKGKQETGEIQEAVAGSCCWKLLLVFSKEQRGRQSQSADSRPGSGAKEQGTATSTVPCLLPPTLWSSVTRRVQGMCR